MILRATFASLMFFCASSAFAQEPQWLKDARTREGKLGQPRDFKSKDNWLKGRVPGKVVGKVEKVEGSYSIEIDFADESPVYCEFVPDGFYLADTMRRMLDVTMKQFSNAPSKVEARELEYSDAGAIGNVPYLKTRWLFRVNDGKETSVGMLKQFVMEKQGHGLYCAHLDIGYVNTFDTLMQAFAETLKTETGTPDPYYMEIAVAKLGAQIAGITVMALSRDEEGDTKTVQGTSMMVPAAGGELHTQDSVQIEWVKPDAAMINASHFVTESGEVSTNIGLKWNEDHWAIQGELQGKEVTMKIPGEADPGTWLGQALAIRALLAGANPVGTEHSIPLWIAADPGKLTDAKTKVLAKSGDDFTGRATAGAIDANVVLDKSGSVKVADLQMGPQKMTIERVFVKGSF